MTYTLNGTNSSDNDGVIVTYQWAKIAGPTSFAISGATTATPQLSLLRKGIYEMELTVTDNEGGVSKDRVFITVVNLNPNVAPVANAGADQVTIGSLAVKDPEKVKEWIITYGADRIILGADVKERRIAVSGWLETSNLNLFDFIDSYYQLGIRHVLCTDISKDGMLEGPAFELYNEIMKKYSDLQLIASGGVSGIEDVKQLKANGIPSVVIGKAIYEGRIDLNELAKLNA